MEQLESKYNDLYVRHDKLLGDYGRERDVVEVVG